MKKLTLSIIITLLLFLNFKLQANSNSPLIFIEKYKDTALELMQEHNIPASIIIGISFHESAYGTSKLSKVNNNFFGIKRSENLYRIYENDTESFQDFCNLISNKKYYNYLITNNVTDYNTWLRKIKNGGYAEDPLWLNKIESLIKKYKLYELDTQQHIC